MDLESLMKRQNEIEQSIRQVMQSMVEVANSHQRTSAILETLAERQLETEESLNSMSQEQANSHRRMGSILETLAERQRETEESLNRLSEKQAITEENLNVLLLTVERHIAGHK